MLASQILETATTVFLTFAFIFLGISAVLRMIVFFSAWLSKQRLVALVAVVPPAMESPIVVGAAQAADFQHIGQWRSHPQGKRIMTLMLSQDGSILLVAEHGRSSFRMQTRLDDGRWVITGSTVLSADLSGLEEVTSMLRVDFFELLNTHNAMVLQAGGSPVLFSPDTIAQDLWDHDRAMLDRLIERRYARMRQGEGDRWSYTLGGALRFTAGTFRNAREAAKEAKQRRRQQDRRVAASRQ